MVVDQILMSLFVWLIDPGVNIQTGEEVAVKMVWSFSGIVFSIWKLK